MKIEKQVLLEMEGVYAVGCIRRGGQKKLLVSTEMQGCCYELDFRTHEKVCVWNGPGGVMGFADVDAEDGGFCAIQNFFPVFYYQGPRYGVGLSRSRQSNGPP